MNKTATYEVRSMNGNSWGKVIASNFATFAEAETFANDLNKNARPGFRFGVCYGTWAEIVA